MTIKTEKFWRKPFSVDAVQVTLDNMEEIAKWCKGKVHAERRPEDGPFVKVKVHRPLNDRQTEAYVGDWVLYAGSGFKVYNPTAFEKSFESDEKRIIHRSAVSGQIVSAEEAKENPDTTVTEEV